MLALPPDELGLLKALRDSLERHYGDVGLGSSLLSLQGKLEPWNYINFCKQQL